MNKFFSNILCIFLSKDINPKTIILAGDSAGGNLVAAVTGMAIKLGARVPDGILLSYPGKELINSINSC